MRAGRRSFRSICFLAVSLVWISCSERESTFQLVIEPVDYTRTASPYYFTMPDSILTDGIPYLESADRPVKYPIQQVASNQWVFIPDSIPTGKSETFELVYMKQASDHVRTRIENGKLTMLVKGKPVLNYQMETLMPPPGNPEYYQKGGFIHPAYSPGGQVITDGFPEGHMHQHGIFFAWVNTRFQGRDTDFWNQQDETGTVVFDQLIDHKEGPVFGEFKSSHIAVAFNGVDTTEVLQELWTVRVYNISDYFLWDMEVDQENISMDTLHVLQYHYGGMAFRGSAEWNDTTAANGAEKYGPGQGGFLTSEGLGRAGNHTRPNWVSMFGNVNSTTVSLVAMNGTKNFRSPQYVRIHPNMPYFCFLPMVDNGFNFKPGDVYKARFRVLTMNGAPDTQLIDQQWKQYTAPQ